MPALTTTVPTARAALHNLIAAAPALAGVQVSYSHPGDAVETDTVYLGDARGRQEPATIRAGRRSRDEEYTIDVWVETTVDGPSAADADVRVWALAAAVEDVVANDASLGLAQPFWAGITEKDQRLGFDEDRRGWACRVRLGVLCKARLV